MRKYKDIVKKSENSDKVDVTLLFIAVVKTEMEHRKGYVSKNAYVQTQPDKKLVNDETIAAMVQNKDKRDDANTRLGSTKVHRARRSGSIFATTYHNDRW